MFDVKVANATILYFSQTTENTAKVLIAAGYNCECRGQIPVKGKGILTTYFVKTPFDDKL
jgi:adenylate cyclase 2